MNGSETNGSIHLLPGPYRNAAETSLGDDAPKSEKRGSIFCGCALMALTDAGGDGRSFVAMIAHAVGVAEKVSSAREGCASSKRERWWMVGRLPLVPYPLHLTAGDLAATAVVELGGARIGVAGHVTG